MGLALTQVTAESSADCRLPSKLRTHVEIFYRQLKIVSFCPDLVLLLWFHLSCSAGSKTPRLQSVLGWGGNAVLCWLLSSRTHFSCHWLKSSLSLQDLLHIFCPGVVSWLPCWGYNLVYIIYIHIKIYSVSFHLRWFCSSPPLVTALSVLF